MIQNNNDEESPCKNIVDQLIKTSRELGQTRSTLALVEDENLRLRNALVVLGEDSKAGENNDS